MTTVDPMRAGETTAYGGASSYGDVERERGEGWVLFAGTMLLLVGTLNVIDGIAAISNSTFFTENARFMFSDLNTFGWIVLVLGGAQILTAVGVWAKLAGARWLGVTFAAVNAIAQLVFIPAYPLWSLSLFTLDLLVIYGLVAYGRRSS